MAGARAEDPPPTAAVSRREALKRLSCLVAGLAVGCTPVRIVFKAIPEAYEDPALAERMLVAFVTTVVPGVSADDPNLTRVFGDPFYPFAGYRTFFVSDLCRRATDRFGAAFDRLTPEQRAAVIQQGLRADPTTRKLYTGAVFLAQIAVFGGIYDAERGSPLIDFEGRYRFRGRRFYTYTDPERFLARALTPTGNPA